MGQRRRRRNEGVAVNNESEKNYDPDNQKRGEMETQGYLFPSNATQTTLVLETFKSQRTVHKKISILKPNTRIKPLGDELLSVSRLHQKIKQDKCR